ncbi:hypothetical protein E2C01_087974 [Portunus trituberculatus]|uniref:Uncharacterized protein n=1 Tax=Portunus trituberculatus TaxID=210409 RepID=A0A5B7J9J2_PORTR|nr:hypothetical protein [Portunus trituberculatus]
MQMQKYVPGLSLQYHSFVKSQHPPPPTTPSPSPSPSQPLTRSPTIIFLMTLFAGVCRRRGAATHHAASAPRRSSAT